MSKRILWVAVLALTLLAILSACGGAAAQPTAATSGGLKVGLVTDVGKIDDKSFNQTAWEGVQQAQKELGLGDIKYIETTDPKDYAKNMAQFADAKYDVIVTVGFALTEATYQAAKKYPNVKFIGVDQFLSNDKDHPDWPLPNLIGVVFEEDKAGFLAGALAGLVSKTGTIGGVFGTDVIPPVWRYGEGYRAGAKYAKPDIKITIVYHNDVGLDKTFTDPEWGRTTAQSMIDKGADVIFGGGGKTGNGALLGVAEKGKMCIGVDTDQYFTVPEATKCLITSAVKLETPSVYATIKQAKDGSWKPGLYIGPTGIAPYHDFDSQISSDVKAKIDQINKGLQDGSIKTGVSPAKPS